MSKGESEIASSSASLSCNHEDSFICLERTEKWYCLSCGAAGDTEFCTNCGYKRDNGLKGSIFLLGAYEQDNNENNGPEAIEWIVLEDRGDIAYLLSRYVLDYGPFDKDGKTNVWKDCTLRKWMNEEFYNVAFNTEEQQYFDKAKITTNGIETFDYVFLLGSQTAENDFESDDIRKCVATVSAGAGAAAWWLRTPSSVASENTTEFVGSGGVIWGQYAGGTVDMARCVRPALLVNIT